MRRRFFWALDCGSVPLQVASGLSLYDGLYLMRYYSVLQKAAEFIR